MRWPAWSIRRMTHRQKLAERLVTLLWRGQTPGLLKVLQAGTRRLGPPAPDDGPVHPRRIAAQNVGYFEKHQAHMNYPAYRKHGWPIGSGITEAGVKQFNQRVKGTEQFWSESGAEAILALPHPVAKSGRPLDPLLVGGSPFPTSRVMCHAPGRHVGELVREQERFTA